MHDVIATDKRTARTRYQMLSAHKIATQSPVRTELECRSIAAVLLRHQNTVHVL